MALNKLMEANVVSEVLQHRAQEQPDKVFWITEGETITYAEADRRANQIASGLDQIGLRSGDRVAVLSGNRSEFLEVIFGLAKIGAIQVPLNIYLKGDFLQYQIEQSGTEVAFADGQGLTALLKIAEQTALKTIIAFDDFNDLAIPSGIRVIPFRELHVTADVVLPNDVRASSLMAIMYTSGTTGMPKGCMLSHGYYLKIGYEAQKGLLTSNRNDTVYTAAPLFHGLAQIISLMSTLVSGGAMALDSKFSASSIVDRWIETGATLFAGIGMMGTAILKRPPSKSDRSHKLRHAVIIPFGADQQQEFLERFGATVSSQGYAQTECAPVSAMPSDGGKPESSGKPLPHIEVAIVDDEDNPLEPGAVGEIVVRPKTLNSMFSGYWRNPEATLNAWRNLWHHTGDLGRFDNEGYLYFVDRKKDSLRRRGENIASAEVEAAIMKHPRIQEAAIVAVPSELTEDEVMACMVIDSGEKPAPEELFDFLKDSIPYFAVPRYVRFFDELPKTASMKIQKNKLREQGITDDTWDFEEMGLIIQKSERR